MRIIPAKTQIQGETRPWDEEIEALWEANVEPLFREGEACVCANFFRPRRYRNEYDRGSCEIGFTYTVVPGHRVCQWTEKIVDVPLGTPTEPLGEYEVWSEGYAATGESGTAVFHGKVRAASWRAACVELLGSRRDFDPARMTLWGCRLFDNEREARESFG